jgi:hypothetical protein
MSLLLKSKNIYSGVGTSSNFDTMNEYLYNSLKSLLDEIGFKYYLKEDDAFYFYLNEKLTFGFKICGYEYRCYTGSTSNSTWDAGAIRMLVKDTERNGEYEINFGPKWYNLDSKAQGNLLYHNFDSSFKVERLNYIYNLSASKKSLVLGFSANGYINNNNRSYLPIIITEDIEGKKSIIVLEGVCWTGATTTLPEGTTLGTYEPDHSVTTLNGRIACLTEGKADFGFLNTFRANPTAPTTMLRMPTFHDESYFSDVYYIISTPLFKNYLHNIIAIGDKRYQICYCPGMDFGPLLAVEVGDD